ncbi:VHS-domain-containing protein, partial [Gonapodya prolifera JEL478]
EADLNLNMEICELINKKGSGWPRDAALLTLRVISNKSQQSGLLALTLLDNLVKNCGMPFQMQVGSKEFLGALVKNLPEIPPPIPNALQYRILELLQEWNATLAEGRYAEDFRNVRAVWNYLQYKGYRLTSNFDANTSVLKDKEVLRSEKEMEDEDRKHHEAKLQELLRRKTPEALAEANELMKTLAGYDFDSRPDYKGKFLQDLDKLEKRAEELKNSLNAATSLVGDTKIMDLYDACKGAQNKIQKWLREETDPESTSRLLALNDLLNDVLREYDARKLGKSGPEYHSPAFSAKAPATTSVVPAVAQLTRPIPPPLVSSGRFECRQCHRGDEAELTG